MNNYKKNREFLWITLGLVFFIGIVRILIVLYEGNATLSDHAYIWQECRLMFWGYNPYGLSKQIEMVRGIQLHSSVSSLPWGLALGIITHGAFLPLKAANVWYVCLRLAVDLMAVITTVKRGRKNAWDIEKCCLVVLCYASSWYLVDCLCMGNDAQILCALIIIAINVMDKHPYISGILMTFAMVKPQIALPFFALFLLGKKNKLIITSVLGVLLAWTISAVRTKTSPLVQIKGLFAYADGFDGEGAEHIVVGICDPLRKLGVDNMVAMLLSMLVGMVVLVACLLWLCQKKIVSLDVHRWLCVNDDDKYLLYSITAVVSVIWCYKSASDYMILNIIALAVIEQWDRVQNRVCQICLLFAVICVFTKPFSTALLGKWFSIPSYTCNRLDLMLKLMALFILIGGSIYGNRLTSKE